MVDADEGATAPASATLGHASDEDSTRERVLAMILAASPISASELATALNLTAAAVRRHLEWLESAGKITTRTLRSRGVRGRGRPAKAYVVTDSGRGDFHHEYDRMALLAIDELVATSGPAGMDRLATEFFAPIARGVVASGETTGTTASSLVEALNSCGYVASLTRLSSGVQLIQHQCPVADVARAHPQLCEIETAMFSRLLHSHVQRLATIAHGDPACTTHIPNPITPNPVIPNPVTKTQHSGGRNTSTREVD
jgi:predicted ArsR family transcriptional regulator